MTKSKGFTLIELLIFVIILAIIISILRTAISFA
ncbi:MAG TPA: prepilin-type cleavage/methylation domain-containing protein, partial [Coxiellaceae bacterium]|nr:prepilin-type cleavage/methylation domain-containing protein [Coxiellaceae bacterium]